jgi:hypothetical protein
VTIALAVTVSAGCQPKPGVAQHELTPVPRRRDR